MSPEWQIIVINAVVCAVAYFGIYPTFKPITWTKILVSDAAVTCAALGLAGMLFAGSGVRFTLIAVETHWAVFSLATFFAIESPLVIWFALTQDIEDG